MINLYLSRLQESRISVFEEHMKILIVDDSRTARMMIKSMVTGNEQQTFFEAENGEKAVEVFNREKPDLTFLDLTMPVMDGFQALEIIKSDHKDALIIVLSADIQKKAVERVLSLGAYKFLKKPLSPTDVQQVMSEIQTELANRG